MYLVTKTEFGEKYDVAAFAYFAEAKAYADRRNFNCSNDLIETTEIKHLKHSVLVWYWTPGGSWTNIQDDEWSCVARFSSRSEAIIYIERHQSQGVSMLKLG